MFFQMFALLLCALPPSASGWSTTTGPGSVRTTYLRTDPRSGVTLTCDRCAPGSYLRTPCTDTRKSVCAACPPGAFTALWNHLEACLPCGACSGDAQEVLARCSASRDTACRCAAGHRHEHEHEMCVRHNTCPAGYGVVARGTPDADTRCQPCPPGSYSALDSAQDACLPHSSCAAGGRVLAVPGSAWHDSVCATCHELRERDAADYLRGLLPGFFVHQNMPVTRLRRLLLRLLPGEQVEALGRKELHLLLSGWALRAGPQELRELKTTLRRAGGARPALRLTQKLRSIQNHLTSTLCPEEAQEERGEGGEM